MLPVPVSSLPLSLNKQILVYIASVQHCKLPVDCTFVFVSFLHELEGRFSTANGAGLFTADVMFIYIFMPNDIKRTWSNAWG